VVCVALISTGRGVFIGVTVKPTRERLQGGASRPPPGSTGQWPLHIASSCQVHLQGDTYFGGILIFLIIS
jgi:hypothetical protein